jgi:steroid delta-isomerase-like uncharacterized protein
MRSMRIGALVVGPILVGLVACGGDEPQPQTPPPPPAATVNSAQTAEPPPAPPEPPKPTLAELQQASGKSMLEALNAHDADKLVALYTDDVVSVHAGRPPMNGKDAIKQSMTDLFTAFPDSKFAGARVFVKDAVVISEFGWTGTNSGDFMGQKATNKQVGQMGLGIYWYTPEGKVKESHMYLDGGSLAFQLGWPKAKGRPMEGLPTSSEAHVSKGSPDEDKNVAVDRAITATFVGKGDPKAFLDFLSDDCTYESNTMPKPMVGKKDAKGYFVAFTKAFPDVKESLSNVWGIEDYVVDEYVTTGTQKAALVGPAGTIPATNKAVELHGAEILQIKDGKLVKGWGYENSIEMLSQLGLMPQHKPAAAAAAGASDKAPAKK